jgi:hypothetical protein
MSGLIAMISANKKTISAIYNFCMTVKPVRFAIQPLGSDLHVPIKDRP